MVLFVVFRLSGRCGKSCLMGSVVLLLRNTSCVDITGGGLRLGYKCVDVLEVYMRRTQHSEQSAPSLGGALQLCVSSLLTPHTFWFPSVAANSDSVFLAFRQQPASVCQQRWNHCAQRHQAWKQVSKLQLCVFPSLPIFLLSLYFLQI